MNIYDLVKKLLTEKPELRDSDKKLLIKVWMEEGVFHKAHIEGTEIWDNNYFFNFSNFYLKATSAESITRARRKVQEQHPELRAEIEVEQARKDKEEQKGLFIFKDKPNYDKYSN